MNYKEIKKQNTGYRTQKEGASVTEGAFPNKSIRLTLTLYCISCLEPAEVSSTHMFVVDVVKAEDAHKHRIYH